MKQDTIRIIPERQWNTKNYLEMKKRKYVEVFYDHDLRNWDEVIDQELKRRGLEHAKITVIARPKETNRSDCKTVAG